MNEILKAAEGVLPAGEEEKKRIPQEKLEEERIVRAQRDIREMAKEAFRQKHGIWLSGGIARQVLVKMTVCSWLKTIFLNK